MTKESLKDKTVIVSGGSRGIGRAVAMELAREGANISFNFRSSESEAKELEKEIQVLGVKVKGSQVDIKDYDAVKSWVTDTVSLFGGLDIVVNNAGITKDGALALMSPDNWKEVISTNLDGTFNLTKAAILIFMKQKSGNVINITSVSGVMGMARQTNYAASKSGIIGFSKSLAKEVAAYNIRVNAVAPGFIETDILKDLKEDYMEQMIRKIPLGRLGESVEVAKVVKFLASNDSKYITGQTIIIDGGLSSA
ncbi:3-oxoacyl-[acyl-carrier-protein] reductase FabG [bacterium BMS3Bbin09]|nr:3-oxoacyl-[acyl-carrier-protein] reductase FabG [bacterium BMS3Bbin09]